MLWLKEGKLLTLTCTDFVWVFVNQKTVLSFSVLFLILFLLVTYFRGSFSDLNLGINLWSASINHDFFNLTAQIISIIFDTISLATISVAIAFILFAFHLRRYCLLLLGAMGGVAVLVAYFKAIITSPRPSNMIIFDSGYSYPSGHTTSSVVFFGIWHILYGKIMSLQEELKL